MSVIVGVHGIAQQYKGGNALRNEWLPALRDGLEEAGHQDLSDGFRDTDLKVSFFGSFFRPKGAMGADFPPYTAEDLMSELEVDLLTDLYNQAVLDDPRLGPPVGSLSRVRVSVQLMVERLLRSRAFAGLIPERAFVGSLKQVILFLTDTAVKDSVLARVHDTIGGDTRALVGHSLGSIVTYEYLCKYQPSQVEVLVTLGSPLGIRNVIFDRLTPTPGAAGGVWPGAVSSWVNVADPKDVVALRKDLQPLFTPPAGTKPIDDRRVDVGGFSHHRVGSYLNAEETGSALAQAL